MRSFVWRPQEHAELCLTNNEHVHVVIASPEGRTIIPSCKKESIHLFFHDLDPEAVRRSKAFENDADRGQKIIDLCFNEDQARQIVEFVKRTDPLNVVVNCEAGISRSPGVVLALRRFYGGDADEPCRRAIPNIHVTSVLTRVLREESHGA